MAGSQEKWFFTKEQLQNSPSRRCGLDADKELAYRQQAANLIQDMGQRLQVSQLCINTAIVYMHRFYAFHSFTQFHRNAIAAAALFLAAKVEEQPRKLEYVIKVAHVCVHRGEGASALTSEQYTEQVRALIPEKAQDLVFNENVLLQTLGFDVAIDHPHTHVVQTCQLVKAPKDLAQTSYFMASNSLHLTTMCLQYRPTVVACFCIHLASKWSNWVIPQSNEGRHWFTYVDRTVTPELLERLTVEFLHIFDKCPSRLRRKMMTMNNSGSGSSPHAPGGSSSSPFDKKHAAQLEEMDKSFDKEYERERRRQQPAVVGGYVPSGSGAPAPAPGAPPPQKIEFNAYRERREREERERRQQAQPQAQPRPGAPPPRPGGSQPPPPHQRPSAHHHKPHGWPNAKPPHHKPPHDHRHRPPAAPAPAPAPAAAPAPQPPPAASQPEAAPQRTRPPSLFSPDNATAPQAAARRVPPPHPPAQPPRAPRAAHPPPAPAPAPAAPAPPHQPPPAVDQRPPTSHKRHRLEHVGPMGVHELPPPVSPFANSPPEPRDRRETAKRPRSRSNSEPELVPVVKKLDETPGYEHVIRDSQRAAAARASRPDRRGEGAAPRALNGIETDPALVSNLLKESLARPSPITVATERRSPVADVKRERDPPVADPPTVTPAPPPAPAPAPVAAAPVAVAAAAPPPQPEPAPGLAPDKEKHKKEKKKKEKHKHRDRDKSRDERKKHKKDKDRKKESSPPPAATATATATTAAPAPAGGDAHLDALRITIPRDKLATSPAALKIKIPKERLAAPPPPPAASLKIKISKEVLDASRKRPAPPAEGAPPPKAPRHNGAPPPHKVVDPAHRNGHAAK